MKTSEGGGKTHMMIALALAKHPHLRTEVLPADLASRLNSEKVRIAAFNGRNDPENFIWGEIATQLGEEEAIKSYWANGPKSVDQNTWKKIIGDKPTLIMIDELPPYLDNASTRKDGPVGGSKRQKPGMLRLSCPGLLTHVGSYQ